MQDISRRNFIKGALAGAAAIATSAAFTTRVLAAEDLKDVKFAKDPGNLQPGLEAAHTPSVTLEKADAKSVAYGKTPAGDFYRVAVQARHEATRDHHISEIALYLNGELVAQHKMPEAQAEASLPTVVFVQRLKAGDQLLAVTDCNRHGKWGNKLTV